MFPLGIGGPNEGMSVNKKNNLFLPLKDARGHSVFPNPNSLIRHCCKAGVIHYFKVKCSVFCCPSCLIIVFLATELIFLGIKCFIY